MAMDRIQTLEIFVAVAKAESFAAGARALGLSAPSVTRGINALEERLGARLFTRTTRKIRLTEVGAAYLIDAQAVLAQLQAADDAASGAAVRPQGHLRITCPSEFGRLHIMPIVTAYLDAHPDVTAQVLVVDRIVNIIEEGVDVALRIGHLPSSGLSAIKVGEVRLVVCAAPDYLARWGKPEKPEDLADHRIIATATDGPTTEWRFGAKQNQTVRLKPTLEVTSVAASISVAREGWGLCRCLSYQVAEDVRAGRLIPVLEAFRADPVPIHLVHAGGGRTSVKLRSFLDFASRVLRSDETRKKLTFDPS